MTTTSIHNGFPRPDRRILLAAAMAVMLVFLLARGTGIYPVVFADEWSYSSFSRLLPLSQAGVPSYLYLFLYRATNYCGDGFLDCARVLNCVFMVLAIPFVYRVTRLVCGPRLSFLVALLAVAGPINTYAIYFMPEAMYFMGFWVLTWVVLTRSEWSPLSGLAIGVITGLLSLVKIHALFLVPALIGYVGLLTLLQGDAGAWRRALWTVLAMCLGLVATKFMLGYLLAGRSGLSIFGQIYGAQAGSAKGEAASRALALAPKALFSLAGHLMALAVLFAIPLARLASGLQVRRRSEGSVDASVRIRLYAVLVLATLVAVVALFTAVTDGTGPLETAGRLHMRYYNFAFPILLIVGAAEIGRRDRPGLGAWIAAAVVVAVAGYAAIELLPAYTPSMVDSPELRGVSTVAAMFIAVAGLAIASVVAWAVRPKWGAVLFLAVLAPVVALVGSWQVSDEVRRRQVPDQYDEAGQFSRRYLGGQVEHLAVVAPHPAPLLRALFHLDNVNVAAHQQKEGTELALEQLPKGTAWLLMIGNYELGEGLRSTLDFGSFSLVQVARERTIDFKAGRWPGVIRSSGLSWAEPWGRWTDRQNLEIEFATTFPAHFELALTGHALGGNGTFVVHVGNVAREYSLPTHDDGRSSAVFHTDGNERIVRISVPRPVVPKDLGLGDDPRELGLGLRELTIKTIR